MSQSEDIYKDKSVRELRQLCISNNLAIPLFASREVMIEKLNQTLTSSGRRTSRSPSPIPSIPSTPQSKKANLFDTPTGSKASAPTPTLNIYSSNEQNKSPQIQNSQIKPKKCNISLLFVILSIIFLLLIISLFVPIQNGEPLYSHIKNATQSISSQR